jgi:hypothetical protein
MHPIHIISYSQPSDLIVFLISCHLIYLSSHLNKFDVSIEKIVCLPSQFYCTQSSSPQEFPSAAAINCIRLFLFSTVPRPQTFALLMLKLTTNGDNKQTRSS